MTSYPTNKILLTVNRCLSADSPNDFLQENTNDKCDPNFRTEIPRTTH